MYLNSKIYIFILSFLMFFLMHCTAPKNQSPTTGASGLEKIYVDRVDSEKTISISENLELKIEGNLPSPAYTFERFEVKVNGKVIEVTPLAKYDPDKIAVQMLLPFNDICTVENLEPGTYKVQVHGRGEKVTHIEGIEVKL